jgi:hypothetical protein
MDAFVFYPENESQWNKIVAFAKESEMQSIQLSEDEKKRLARVLLANLAQKNPKAYATDEEIISAVEEVRHERYGKRS